MPRYKRTYLRLVARFNQIKSTVGWHADITQAPNIRELVVTVEHESMQQFIICIAFKLRILTRAFIIIQIKMET